MAAQNRTETPEAAATRFADEVERLRAENEGLRNALEESHAENDKVRGLLDEARANEKATPNVRPKPVEPSFGLSEGQRAELEQHGKTVSPYTGARQVGDGRPRDKSGKSPVRTVDAETYDKTPNKQQQEARK
jgi:hypothetical protein